MHPKVVIIGVARILLRILDAPLINVGFWDTEDGWNQVRESTEYEIPFLCSSMLWTTEALGISCHCNRLWRPVKFSLASNIIKLYNIHRDKPHQFPRIRKVDWNADNGIYQLDLLFTYYKR